MPYFLTGVKFITRSSQLAVKRISGRSTSCKKKYSSSSSTHACMHRPSIPARILLLLLRIVVVVVVVVVVVCVHACVLLYGPYVHFLPSSKAYFWTLYFL